MRAFQARPPDPRFAGEGWREQWLGRLEDTPPYIEEWLTHQRRDSYWRHGSVREDYGAIVCPVFVVGGWADPYTNAVPRLLEGLSVPRLGLIGPWSHGFPQEVAPGPNVGFLQECVRWWDHWLKGIENGVMDAPMLRAWVQESVPPAAFYNERPGRWVAEAAWPPADGCARVWTLEGDGALCGAAGGAADRPVALERPHTRASVRGRPRRLGDPSARPLVVEGGRRNALLHPGAQHRSCL